MQSRETDVEWILELRSYNKKLKNSSLKNVNMSQPSFYDADLDKFKLKIEKEKKKNNSNPLRVTGNIQDFEHVIFKRLEMPANPGQVGFDTTLRKNAMYESVHGPKNSWKTLSISPKKNLLSFYLPPINQNSIRNLEKIENLIIRPLEPVIDVCFYL
jgi:hypothetical protein